MKQKMGLEFSRGWIEGVNTISYDNEISGIHMIK